MSGSAAAATVVDRVAAVVNDEIILLSEVYDLGGAYIGERMAGGVVRRAAEGEVLERLIERKLIAQEVRELNLAPTDQELDRAIDDTARRNGLDRDGLKVELEKQGIGWDEYRDQMREDLQQYKFGQAVLRPRISISDDELKDLWLRSGNAGAQEATVLALALALPKDATDAQKAEVRARADAIVAEAQAGKDFVALAKQYDESTFAERNGEMGSFRQGELVGPLDRAVFAAPVGVPTVVEMPSAILVIDVTRRGGASQGFEEAKERLANQIFGERMEDEQVRWFEQARREAAIRVLLPGA